MKVTTKGRTIQLHLDSNDTCGMPVIKRLRTHTARRLILDLVRAFVEVEATGKIPGYMGKSTQQYLAEHCQNMMIDVAIKFDNEIEKHAEDETGFLLQWLTDIGSEVKNHEPIQVALEGLL